MDFVPLYWHWIVFGLVLIGFEIFILSLVTIWFGVSAIVLGFLLLVHPLSFGAQLLVWSGLTLTFLELWQAFVSPRLKKATLSNSREAIIGKIGMVISYNASSGHGLLRFATPILGAEEWSFICEEALVSGDRALVLDLSGNKLLVKKSS